MYKQLKKTVLDLSSATATSSSDPVDMSLSYGYSVQIVWTSTTCSASFKVQGSNDDGSTWIDLSGQSQAVSNDSGSALINFPDCMFEKMRVTFDYSSGTLTSGEVIVFTKG